jgi:hypothetical protein
MPFDMTSSILFTDYPHNWISTDSIQVATLAGVLPYFLLSSGGGGGGERSPTVTNTSSSPTSTVYNIFSAVNDGASLPTPVVAQTQKREVDVHMGLIDTDFISLSPRHLEK